MVKQIVKKSFKESTSIFIRNSIITEFLLGKKNKEIAEKFKCNLSTVSKWVKKIKEKKETREINYKIPASMEEIKIILDNLDFPKKKKKKTRLTRTEKRYLYKQFANKRTGGKDSSSIRKVIARANKKFHLKKEKKLSYSTIQRYTKETFKKIKYKKTPMLTDEQKKKRKEFGDYIINNNIDYKSIFFTDEKQFELIYTPNKQNNQIRLTKLSKKD